MLNRRFGDYCTVSDWCSIAMETTSSTLHQTRVAIRLTNQIVSSWTTLLYPPFKCARRTWCPVGKLFPVFVLHLLSYTGCLVGSVNHVIMLVCETSLKWMLLMLHYAWITIPFVTLILIGRLDNICDYTVTCTPYIWKTSYRILTNRWVTSRKQHHLTHQQRQCHRIGLTVIYIFEISFLFSKLNDITVLNWRYTFLAICVIIVWNNHQSTTQYTMCALY